MKTIEIPHEIKEYCFEMFMDSVNSEEDAKEYFKDYTDNDFNVYLELHHGFERLSYDYKEIYKNAFFTAKACDDHIRRNAHHYSEKACSYGASAWRNPEIELIHKFLEILATNK
jgi:hypothetical protein